MVGVSALVTTLVLGVGALSIYTMHSSVASFSDAEVRHSLAALDNAYTKMRLAPSDTTNSGVLTGFVGHDSGTVIAEMRDGQITQSAMFSDDGPQSAPVNAIAALESLRWTEDSPRTIDVGASGRYRVASIEASDGTRLISAVSLADAERVVLNKVVAVAIITAVAAVLAAAGTVILVRRSLRPLRRVAATAAKVAKMPLNDDDQRITARVRRADSDPDNEVGIVGETVNRMLANVDSALVARAETDRRMRQFLADASHELRTPLAAIHGYAQLTRHDAAELPAATEYALARIESESQRMGALIADMLLLSRLSEGRDLDMEPVDLCALVADAINDVVVTAPDHRYLAELPDDPAWVCGDHPALHQVVANLLANARDHTPPGTSVTTTLRAYSDVVELTVADDGPGIDPEIMPDLFGRFVRANKARSREMNNTGLGLAIVKSITEVHGGTVSAESQIGQTEFLVRLARVDVDIPSDASLSTVSH